MASVYTKTYAERISHFTNPTAKLILETIERKRSNLAVSVDVTTSEELLTIVQAVGPYVCMTHVDVVEDFDFSLIEKLQSLSSSLDFVIFEDRKFADIGNTVALQYSSGVYKISSWSHLTNAHPVPGPSIIQGLGSVGRPLGRGLLLLAEMSTKGALTVGAYTDSAVQMARENRDFVIGFIAQRRLEGIGAAPGEDTSGEDFLILSPGVGLDARSDGMGQQYKTPREAIVDSGSDIIIVGRGIYGGSKPRNLEAVASKAERYMAEGWAAYQERLGSK